MLPRNMFTWVIFLLFATAVLATEPFYWRLYNGEIPSDAISTEDSNVFIGRVGVCYNAEEQINLLNFYPATLNATSQTATTAILAKKAVISNVNAIMVLCSPKPTRLKWKYVNIASVQGDFLNNLVRAGYYSDVYRYVGKVFHDNQWKISTVYQYGHKWAGLRLWHNKSGDGFTVNDFQILMYD